jgi:hypothetical protein
MSGDWDLPHVSLCVHLAQPSLHISTAVPPLREALSLRMLRSAMSRGISDSWSVLEWRGRAVPVRRI